MVNGFIHSFNIIINSNYIEKNEIKKLKIKQTIILIRNYIKLGKNCLKY